jgi:hypothetical protein
MFNVREHLQKCRVLKNRGTAPPTFHLSSNSAFIGRFDKNRSFIYRPGRQKTIGKALANLFCTVQILLFYRDRCSIEDGGTGP